MTAFDAGWAVLKAPFIYYDHDNVMGPAAKPIEGDLWWGGRSGNQPSGYWTDDFKTALDYAMNGDSSEYAEWEELTGWPVIARAINHSDINNVLVRDVTSQRGFVEPSRLTANMPTTDMDFEMFTTDDLPGLIQQHRPDDLSLYSDRIERIKEHRRRKSYPWLENELMREDEDERFNTLFGTPELRQRYIDFMTSRYGSPLNDSPVPAIFRQDVGGAE